MAKNKIILVGLLWIALCLPSYTLVGNDGHTVRVIARSYLGVTEKGGITKALLIRDYNQRWLKEGGNLAMLGVHSL